MPAKKIELNTAELVTRYQAGEDAMRLAAEFGVSDATIRRRLREAGVDVRNKSDAGKLVWEQADSTKYAQIAELGASMRGVPKSTEHMDKIMRARANSFENKTDSHLIGKFEDEFAEWLKGYSYPVIRQKAFLYYNIDIVIGDFAIEIWTANNDPLNDRHQSLKIRRLVESGWNVIYVWSGKGRTITENQAQEVRLYIDGFREIPGTYHVIRGDLLV